MSCDLTRRWTEERLTKSTKEERIGATMRVGESFASSSTNDGGIYLL